jgi:hypothetical protein
MIKEMMDKQVLELKKLWQNKRQLLFQVLNLAMIVFSALMIWKGLMFVTKVRDCAVVLVQKLLDILLNSNLVGKSRGGCSVGIHGAGLSERRYFIFGQFRITGGRGRCCCL